MDRIISYSAYQKEMKVSGAKRNENKPTEVLVGQYHSRVNTTVAFMTVKNSTFYDN